MSHFQRRRRQFGEPCDCLKPLIRIFGIITAFVICGVGVDVYLHGYEAGLLILISSIIILLFEVKWVITLFLQLIFGNYVAGLLLILLAVLRLCLVFRFSNNSKDEGLLPQCDFEKVESGPDIPEDGFIEIGPSLEDEEPIDDVC
ncbi:hypothetical protein DOY81_009987 [Sarcophaga bullata]|nr:hypothetical protein DOY81_009987 [Sarcophaga bullata]